MIAMGVLSPKQQYMQHPERTKCDGDEGVSPFGQNLGVLKIIEMAETMSIAHVGWKSISSESDKRPILLGPPGHNIYMCSCSPCKAVRKRSPKVSIKLCDRVLVNEKHPGIVKYIGDLDLMVNILEDKVYIGVKLDEPVGEHDGVHHNKRFFTCPQKHGVIVPIEEVKVVYPRDARKIKNNKPKSSGRAILSLSSESTQMSADNPGRTATSCANTKSGCHVKITLPKKLSSNSLGGGLDTEVQDATDETGKEDDAVLKRTNTASIASNQRSSSLCSQKGESVSATSVRSSLSDEESPTSSVSSTKRDLLSGLPSDLPLTNDSTPGALDSEVNYEEEYGDLIREWGGGERAYAMVKTLKKLQDAQRRGRMEVEIERQLEIKASREYVLGSLQQMIHHEPEEEPRGKTSTGEVSGRVSSSLQEELESIKEEIKVVNKDIRVAVEKIVDCPHTSKELLLLVYTLLDNNNC